MSERDATDQVDFYWRPGCLFCVSLEKQLDRAGIDFAPHNIWDEDEAAGFVRSVARGTETVPTVVIGDVALVNPSARQVFATMQEVAPHLLPEGFEPPAPRGLGRLLSRMLGGRS
ncbi:MAG: NrdH-redoxin [Acidimicrobiia bacterium]|nr:NrdH-redoxin [Acidimicrobiia bacterium]